jgi:low temperature requirement protein LtrA
MAGTPTWLGVLKGLLVLGVLWWSWVGYAWLTSVVDPEEGSVRLVMFAAMAAFLVAALCVPRCFGANALLFALAYAAVRVAHIALFMLASREDGALRQSVLGLAASTAVGVGLLLIAAFLGGALQLVVWALALILDAGGPFLFGAEGWKLVPGHFAERHGAIIIIALGESVAAIGVGADARVGAGVVAAAVLGTVVAGVLGTVVAGALWWMYFDVVAIVAERRLLKAQEGRERNEIARDSYSYLHMPMVAGIALVAVGMKRTLADVGAPLGVVPAAALLGGGAVYLLAHVAFRWRNIHTLNRQRLGCAGLLGALVAVELALEPAAIVSLATLAAVLSGLIAYEATHFAEMRARTRHQLSRDELVR